MRYPAPMEGVDLNLLTALDGAAVRRFETPVRMPAILISAIISVCKSAYPEK